MCKDTHHPREAMNLQYIQELKRLHFKPKAGVHQQQYLQSVCAWGVGRGVRLEEGVLGGGVFGGGVFGGGCVGRECVWRRVCWEGICLEGVEVGRLTSCLLNCRTYQVCNLGHINHGVQIIATLYQS